MAKVSIIVPTFNRRAVLGRALQSVVDQTYQDWELIVVDDGSNDGTDDFMNEWMATHKHRRTVHYLKIPNSGVSQARNRAAQESSAPWLAFLDSDDEWLPDKLQRQMHLAPHFALVHGEEIWIRRGVRVNPMKKHRKSGGRVFTRCVDLCCVSPSTVLLQRSLFAELGGFRADFPVCEDYELWLRVSARCDLGFTPEPVTIKHGGHPDQLSIRFRAMDYWRVKALVPFLTYNDGLAHDEKQHVAHALIAKCDILLRGYEKHQQMESHAEVQDWRKRAESFLNTWANTHSAADRLPRSLERATL